MNCCDGECHQGRDCPARAAKVASVKRRDYAKEQLPPSTWRYKLQCLAYWVLLALLGWLIWVPLFYLVLRA